MTVFNHGPASYALDVNTGGAGAWAGPVRGGSYLWRVEATSFAGATAVLQVQNLDGTTATNVVSATATANASIRIDIGHRSKVRLSVSGGTPTGMLSSLMGVN